MMFEISDKPRVFALPPGADFSNSLIDGLRQRWPADAPFEPARTQVFVNTRRAARRLREIFDNGPPGLLPQISTLDKFSDSFPGIAPAYASPPIPPLRQKLELAQLIKALIATAPDLAPETASFDLADSLIALFAEASGEGVDPNGILSLDLADQSGHWLRAQRFLAMVLDYFERSPADLEKRCRKEAEALALHWETSPPAHPVLIAGSTGSRGTTNILMKAVVKLPQGAVILPGFDFHMPESARQSLLHEGVGEDHPQYRALSFAENIGVAPENIRRWVETPVPSEPRNRLISMALRPAPVTDQWRTDQEQIADLTEACREITLIEAPGAREEAWTIALGMRSAVEQGKTVALVTPDRQLSRQVSMTLSRWGIEPDDSAGRPLHLSAPGRLLRQVAALCGHKPEADELLALLKHPLVSSTDGLRGPHLLFTRELELWIRYKGVPFPDETDLARWAEAQKSEEAKAWAGWVAETVSSLSELKNATITGYTDAVLMATTGLCAGPGVDGSGGLWEKAAGIEALKAITGLSLEAEAGGTHTAHEFSALLLSLLQAGEVRNPVLPDSRVMIWGTLEARVQTADLIILGGLNEGVWPGTPTADPWLNRQMRKDLGLLMPERRTGLAAHDFQQACGAPEIWLTRTIRDASAETVPSRWLNRLTNLLDGLPNQGGPEALKGMQERGTFWLQMLSAWETSLPVVDPASRPAPRPPKEQRPKQLPVTAISKLIRDPYEIYARYILGLRALRPLRQSPDAPLRGTVVHKILEEYIKCGDPDAAALYNLIDQILPTLAPWPAAQRIWRAKLRRVAPWFLESEARRQELATPKLFEEKGILNIQNPGFTLTCSADRIDVADDGNVRIYDYKTGAPPSKAQQKHYDKQLQLEAMMAEYGAFGTLGRVRAEEAGYIGLGAKPAYVPAPLDDPGPDQIRAQLIELLQHWQEESRGYISRRAMEGVRFESDYDHLARYGEWDDTSTAEPEDVA